MADNEERLSQKPITSDRAGGYLHIIKPGDTPGTWESWQISAENLVANPSGAAIILTNKTGNVSQAIPENTWVENISFKTVSGSPIVKIGTSLNGSDILDNTTIDGFLPVLIQKYFSVSATIYFTIVSGSVNIRIEPKNNYI